MIAMSKSAEAGAVRGTMSTTSTACKS